MLLAPVPRGRLRSLGTCRGGRAGPGAVLRSRGCREKGNEKKSRAPSSAPVAGRHACWPRPDRRARCQLRGHRRSLSTALRVPAAPGKRPLITAPLAACRAMDDPGPRVPRGQMLRPQQHLEERRGGEQVTFTRGWDTWPRSRRHPSAAVAWSCSSDRNTCLWRSRRRPCWLPWAPGAATCQGTQGGSCLVRDVGCRSPP